MKIAIANDHRGYQTKLKIKSILEKKGYEIIDIGTDSEKRVDHPVYAFKLCDYVKEHNVLGIAICGTGIGMSIAANKVRGIRAALCMDEYMAEMSRKHNNANVLCLGARLDAMSNLENATKIVDAFINNFYEGGRHDARLEKIKKIEKENI